MSGTIIYNSNNGYTGKLYGARSMAIYDKDGKEVFHTGFRVINTMEELKTNVDGFPEFYEKLTGEIKESQIKPCEGEDKEYAACIDAFKEYALGRKER